MEEDGLDEENESQNNNMVSSNKLRDKWVIIVVGARRAIGSLRRVTNQQNNRDESHRVCYTAACLPSRPY